MAKKIELLHTTYDESGNVESQEVVHPLTSPDCIIMENGKTLDEVMGDGIATPTLTHEGTSFKVGVGDSNIEVVDGDVAGMTLKGQSYQNILPKPTTLIMETDEKEFKINDKIDSNIIIDDNIAEIATVKGKTIVNAVQEESGSEYTVLGEDLSGQSITHVKETPTLEGQTLVNIPTESDNFTANKEAGSWATSFQKTKNMVKNNTKYLIGIFNYSNETKRYMLRPDPFKEVQSVIIDPQSYGYMISTTVENVTSVGLVLNAKNHTEENNIKVLFIEYQEGMENWDIPYFEGEKYFEANIKGVTLQGQTLVNTIQEPCEDDYVVLGADDGIEISAETSGHGTIEDTVQGGINSAVLEGQTLVNLNSSSVNDLPVVSMSSNTQYTLIYQAKNGIEILIDEDNASNWGYFAIPIKTKLIKPSTKYFLKGNFKNVTQVRLCTGDGTVVWSNFGYLDGQNYLTFTTLDTLPEVPSNNRMVLFLNLTRKTGNECFAFDMTFIEYQEGMENWDIPYFEGMQSVQMPVLKTTGRNLNTGTLALGKIEDDGKVNHITSMCLNPDYIEVMPNTEYSIKWIQEIGNMRVFFYDYKREFIKKNDSATIPSGGTFITPSNCKYIRFHFALAQDGWQDYKVSIHKGNTIPTSYEPYQSSTVTTEKNIFDGILTPDYLTDGTGQPSGLNGSLTHSCYTPSYIPIQANEKFRLRVTSDGSTTVGDGRVYFYDKDYNYLNIYVTSLEVYTNTFSMDVINTVPNNSNIAYMRVRFFNGFGVQADSVQINKVYELRGIGDVKDELDLQTGKLTQRIGEMVLDGSEDWRSTTFDYLPNNFTANIPILNHLNDTNSKGMRALVKDNKGFTNNCVSATVNDSRMNGKKGFSIHNNGNIYFTLPLTECADLTQWKQQLASQPLVVQYAIKPTIKTIDLQTTDQDGNTIPHIQTQPTVTHITASSDYLIPTVTIDNNLAYDTIIKPSTLYTVRFKHDTVNTDNPLTVDLGGTTQTVTSTEFTITTPSELTHNQLVFSGKNNVVSEVQVIEGDMTNIEYPFFEGMNDVRITDTNRNVNLFDINDTVSGYLGGTGTEIKVPDHGNLTSNYIKVKPNTTYVYNHGGFVSNFADYWTGMYFYQDDKGTESNLYTNGSFNRFVHTGQGKKYSNFKFTTPSDCEYIRIGSRGLSYDGAWATLYQLDNFSDSKFIARGKNLLMPSILNPVITNSTQNYAGVNFTYNSDGSFTMTGTFTSNITLHGNADEFIKLLKHGARYRTSEMLLMEVFSLDGNTRWTNDLTFDKNNHIRVSPYYQWNGVVGESIDKTYYPQIEIGDSQTSYEPYKGVEVQQDVDSIPLTSDMFEQGVLAIGSIISGMSLQQIPTGTNGARIYTKLIKVKPNTTYSCVNFGTGLGLWYLEFDKDGLYYGERKYKQNNVFQTTHNTEYVSVCLYYIDESAISPSDLDSMNLFLQEVPQEIVLRGIGDVKDELDLTRGEYIQRIGEIVLDGSENWTRSQYSNDKIITSHFYIEKNSNFYTNTKIKSESNLLTPTFALNTETYTSLETEAIKMAYEFWININKNKLEEDSSNGFKKYLSQNPIKVQYELNTPIIHKVNLTNTKVIPSYAIETHYETITPSDSLIPNITIPSTLNYDVAIKPSTKYTIRANTSDNLTVDLGGTTGTLSNGKVTLTTPATLTHNEVKFSGTGKVKELMVVEGNEIKDNVPFFNGMKDVQMGGIKLVNVCRGMYTWNTGFITLNTNYNQITFTDKGSYGNIQFDEILLKSHTTYTVYFNITENTSTITSPIGVTLSQTNGKETSTYPIISARQTGIMSFTITTDEVAKTPRFVVKSGSTDSKITIKNVMIIEGDWTHLDEIPYIESEMIIEQPIIRSQGKNLFDISRGINYTWHSEYTINGDGSVSVMPTIVDGVAYVQSEFFFLEVGKTYTVSWNASGNAHANFVWLAGTTNSPYGTSNTFTVVEGKNKLTLAMYVDTSSLENVATFKPQIEEGSTATTYEPYKHQTLYSNRVIGYEDGCYYVWDTGTKASSQSISSVTSDVEGLSIAYVTHASSNFSFWNKDGAFISGSMFLSTANDFDKDGFIVVPANAKYMKMACGNQNSSAAKDYHLKATVTGDLPLRSLPNGVCDTLNLVTGEYVQRVGEFILDGDEVFAELPVMANDITKVFYFKMSSINAVANDYCYVVCDKIQGGNKSLSLETITQEGSYMYRNEIRFRISLSKLSSPDVTGFTEWVKQNPITVQYELATPIVRKLGFTTKGNYSQANLATDCEWGASPTTANNTLTTRYRTKSVASLPIVYNTHLFSNDFPIRYFNVDAHQDYEYISNMEYGQYVNVRRDKLEADTVEAFNKWLQHNPIEVGYITNQQSSESYSNIHKPIFFNNVNVQFLPRNLDIQPQLTYQARTRNSYVLDMAKSNTLYTVKAFSNPHSFYIDGKSFGKGTNGCITTPTLTNRLLVTGSSDVKELMIIEGDVTAKNLPYFKGILSSYHDVDEIEIHSANKNLFDMSKVEPYLSSCWNTTIKGDKVISVRGTNIEAGQFGAYAKLNVRPNSTYTLYIEMEKDGEPFNAQVYAYENDDLWGNGTFAGVTNTIHHLKTSQNAKYITIGLNYGKDFPTGTTFVSKNMRLYLGEESPIYIPHAHNTTLIEMPTRLETVKVVRPEMEKGCILNNNGTAADSPTEKRLPFIPVQPGEILSFRNSNDYRPMNVHLYDIDKNFIKYIYTNGTGDLIMPDNCYFIRGFCRETNTSDITITRQAYKPIQLNSLPNGVYDEIIMKPNSNKAQLIQRVGKVVLDGSEKYGIHEVWSKGDIVCANVTLPNKQVGSFACSDRFEGLKAQEALDSTNMEVAIAIKECIRYNASSSVLYLFINKARLGDYGSCGGYGVKEYLKDNPLTVYYQCNPVIHEIQLKGYPHVYENGTVTLNTDTPHQTLVSYNVNQEQLINTQNETIIRHDQQIDDLYYYIEMYLEEIYQMELFRMKLELSL